jgi:FdhE protein
MPDLFEQRLRRTSTLMQSWPHAVDVLGFFRRVTVLQQEIHRTLEEIASRDPEGHDLFLMEPFLKPALQLLETEGPPALASRAVELSSRPYSEWLDFLTMLRAGVEGNVQEGDPLDDPASWCVSRIVVQPYLTSLRRRHPSANAPKSPSRCSFCAGRPLVSVLREDRNAETVRRTLICGLCSTEWDFARVLCPACDEENPEKLPRYTAQEIPWMRVEACDSCGKYLKSVDLTLNGDAEPVVDELASTPLDVIAHEHGYVKITPNLAGI